MQTFAVAGCGDSCRYDVVYGATQIQLWVSVGAFIVATLTVVALSLRGKESWWAPAAGVIIVVVTGIFSTIAMSGATAA